LHCLRCQFENREGVRFCEQCGATLERACHGCGATVPLDRKFCGACGAPLTTSDEASAATPTEPAPTAPAEARARVRTPEGERRQVTVLFADLSGYTELSRGLDPEETHRLLNRFFDAVDAEVQNYGGRVDKHIGDSVMAVFGAPVAHTDDPLRGVRAALDIHNAVADLDADGERPMKVHIGIASGQVVASGTGSDAHREYTVTGDSVNLASRLQDMAGPGETLISDAVYAATNQFVECAAGADVSIKGIDRAIRVWRLRGLRPAAAHRVHRPFVGRRLELRQFTGAVETCGETGSGEAIYVRGESGIGKSRLVEEFQAIAERHGFACHTGLVFDFGIGKGQDAIRAVVRGLLNIAPDGDLSARSEAADGVLAEGVLEPGQRAHLNDLLDLPQPSELRVVYEAMDNETRNQGKRELVAELVKRLSARQPLLIMIEDIHWADEIVLAHLATLASAVNDCPALLIMTSRIEGDPLDQSWRGMTRGAALMTIDLAPLKPNESLELAGEFLDAGNRFAMSCVERAGGNPLFLEELLRSAEATGEDQVPGSIQGIVMARVDNLDAADKQALQAASVIGQRFALEPLRHLIESRQYACAGLIDHYLVRPVGPDFLFAHSLVREGVYSSLLKNRRRDLHARAAAWFAERDPVLHAEHLERAEMPAAARAYHDAAASQIEVFHFERALPLIERGLALAREAGDIYRLSTLEGACLRDMGRPAESIDVYRRALEVASDDVERCHAWIGLASGMRVTDDYDEALEVLAEAERVAREQALFKELSQAHYYRGSIYFPLGNIEGCLNEHQAALDHAQQAGSPDCEVRALSGLGDAYYSKGRMITALGYYQRCIELCRVHGYGRIEVGNRYMVSWNRLYLNQVNGALEDALAAIEAARLVGHDRAEMVARLAAGRVLVDRAEYGDAETHVLRGLELVESLGASRFQPFFAIFLGRVRFAQLGFRQETVRLMRDAVETSRQTGFGFLGPWALSVLALVGDDPAAGDAALAQGEEVLAGGGCVGHNYFDFYRHAMEVALRRHDWDRTDRYADALAAYTEPEPLPWCDYFIAWGRALAAHGRARGKATEAELTRLKDEAARLQLFGAIPALDRARAEKAAAV